MLDTIQTSHFENELCKHMSCYLHNILIIASEMRLKQGKLKHTPSAAVVNIKYSKYAWKWNLINSVDIFSQSECF